jgi:hypothetical protein
MAGVTVPTVLMVLSLISFCVVRFGYDFPFPIERAIVFPLALVPPIWGLWNTLFVALRRHRHLPLGLHGAVIPLFVMPLGFAIIRRSGFDFPALVVTIFPFGVAVVMAGYYLVWKYLVGFLNELVEIGS